MEPVVSARVPSETRGGVVRREAVFQEQGKGSTELRVSSLNPGCRLESCQKLLKYRVPDPPPPPTNGVRRPGAGIQGLVCFKASADDLSLQPELGITGSDTLLFEDRLPPLQRWTWAVDSLRLCSGDGNRCADIRAAVRMKEILCTLAMWLPPRRKLYGQLTAPVLCKQALDLASSEQGLGSLGDTEHWGRCFVSGI